MGSSRVEGSEWPPQKGKKSVSAESKTLGCGALVSATPENRSSQAVEHGRPSRACDLPMERQMGPVEGRALDHRLTASATFEFPRAGRKIQSPLASERFLVQS